MKAFVSARAFFVAELYSPPNLGGARGGKILFINCHMQQEDIRLAETFFNEEAPLALDQLTRDTKPQWGVMTAQHMVEHLIVTYKMAIGRIKIPLVISPEKAERNKAYLIADSPMRRSVPSPSGNNDLQPLRAASLEEAVEKLKLEIQNFGEFIEAHPDHKAIHPYGGELNAEQWLLFNRKHMKHHFIQFGLIPDYE